MWPPVALDEASNFEVDRLAHSATGRIGDVAACSGRDGLDTLRLGEVHGRARNSRTRGHHGNENDEIRGILRISYSHVLSSHVEVVSGAGAWRDATTGFAHPRTPAGNAAFRC